MNDRAENHIDIVVNGRSLLICCVEIEAINYKHVVYKKLVGHL